MSIDSNDDYGNLSESPKEVCPEILDIKKAMDELLNLQDTEEDENHLELREVLREKENEIKKLRYQLNCYSNLKTNDELSEENIKLKADIIVLQRSSVEQQSEMDLLSQRCERAEATLATLSPYMNSSNKDLFQKLVDDIPLLKAKVHNLENQLQNERAKFQLIYEEKERFRTNLLEIQSSCGDRTHLESNSIITSQQNEIIKFRNQVSNLHIQLQEAQDIMQQERKIYAKDDRQDAMLRNEILELRRQNDDLQNVVKQLSNELDLRNQTINDLQKQIDAVKKAERNRKSSEYSSSSTYLSDPSTLYECSRCHQLFHEITNFQSHITECLENRVFNEKPERGFSADRVLSTEEVFPSNANKAVSMRYSYDNLRKSGSSLRISALHRLPLDGETRDRAVSTPHLALQDPSVPDLVKVRSNEYLNVPSKVQALEAKLESHSAKVQRRSILKPKTAETINLDSQNETDSSSNPNMSNSESSHLIRSHSAPRSVHTIKPEPIIKIRPENESKESHILNSEASFIKHSEISQKETHSLYSEPSVVESSISNDAKTIVHVEPSIIKHSKNESVKDQGRKPVLAVNAFNHVKQGENSRPILRRENNVQPPQNTHNKVDSTTEVVEQPIEATNVSKIEQVLQEIANPGAQVNAKYNRSREALLPNNDVKIITNNGRPRSQPPKPPTEFKKDEKPKGAFERKPLRASLEFLRKPPSPNPQRGPATAKSFANKKPPSPVVVRTPIGKPATSETFEGSNNHVVPTSTLPSRNQFAGVPAVNGKMNYPAYRSMTRSKSVPTRDSPSFSSVVTDV